MRLHRNGTNWNRDERNKTNDNWDKIEGNYNNVVENVSEKAFDKVVDSAKLNWKEPVDSFDNLPSDATEGETRMVRETGKVYRYDGADWQEIQEIDSTAINEIDTRLTSQFSSITKSNLHIAIITDLHYSDVDYGGMNPDDRMDFMVNLLNEEHDKKPFDMLFILGDLSSNKPDDSTQKLIIKHLPRLKMPYFCLNGNHDLINDYDWNNLLGYEKNYTVEYGSNVFICLDTFGGRVDPDNKAYGQQYATPNLVWLQNELEKHSDKNIYIMAHYIKDSDNELVNLINQTDNIIAVFQGHLHYDNVGTVSGGKTKITCGHFSYPNQDPSQKSWSYRTLEASKGEVISEAVYFEVEYPEFHQNYERTNAINLTSYEKSLLSLESLRRTLLNIINNKNSAGNSMIKDLDKSALKNTSNVNQNTAGVLRVEGMSEYHIDDLYHTGVYYVGKSNGAPSTGYIHTSGYSSNNFTQLFVEQTSTRKPNVMIRSRSSSGIITEWSHVSDFDISDLIKIQEGFTRDYVIASISGCFVTISGKVSGNFSQPFSTNRVIKLNSSIIPEHITYGTATLTDVSNRPISPAVIRAHVNYHIEISVPEETNGSVNFIIRYKI